MMMIIINLMVVVTFKVLFFLVSDDPHDDHIHLTKAI